MKIRLIPIVVTVNFLIFFGCSSNSNTEKQASEPVQDNKSLLGGDDKEADNAKGIGKFTSVELTHPLDMGMVSKGKEVYEVKCSACHKLTDVKVVGPGWKGVTDRRTPEWIMNFATNTDEMIDKDASAKAMMEVCMVRMPNQNLKDDEVRHVLEFMRSNDGKN